MARRRDSSSGFSASRMLNKPLHLNGSMSVFIILFLIVALSSSDMKWLRYGPEWLN